MTVQAERIVPVSEYSLIDFVALVNKIFQDYVVPINWNVLTFKMDARENSLSLADSFVFLRGGEPVGFILIGIRSRRARVDAMGVVESERGKGLAERILRHAIHHLRLRNVETLTLEVAASDQRAVRFYDKNGFRKVRELHTMVLPTPSNVVSERLNVSFISSECKAIYSMALNFEISHGRKLNWQREPITLLLANGRYSYVRIHAGRQDGYLVWGRNEDNTAFIVDCASNERDWSDITRYAVEHIVEQTHTNLLSAVSVPEDDKLFEALRNVGFETVLVQHEMSRPV